MRKYSNLSIVEFRDNQSKELIDENIVAQQLKGLSDNWSFVSFNGLQARICLDEKPEITTDRDFSEIERSKKVKVLTESLRSIFEKGAIKSISSGYEYSGSISKGINTPKITMWM